ncbi:MAG: carboxylate--amine ligase [Pseudomonadota bacterium]|nr:carboxylate--amine ligase [Pseudomonadota bacterium]
MNSSTSAERQPVRHSRQPLRSMDITVNPRGSVDLARLDGDLHRIFNLVSEPCRCPPSLAGDARAMAAAELVWRGMLLAREFLQAAGIPVFDPGAVARAERAGEAYPWRVRFAIPAIDHIDADCYRLAYGQAVRMVEQLAAASLPPDQVERLRTIAQKQVIEALRRRTLSGKSTIPVLRAAHAMDIPFLHLGGGVYQLGWGSRARKVDRSTVDSDSAIGSRLTQNKVWTAGALRMAGLPAPVHGVVGSAKAALRVARELGWPLVVKPADSDRGEGVTVGIRDEEQLVPAFDLARKASRRQQVIVEREVPGVCHRLFIADGALLYGVKRLPKAVIGDGRHSVAELIGQGNAEEQGRPPWLRGEPFPDDDLAREAAAAAGFTLDAVPPPGVLVPLRIIESTADGGVDEEVTGRVHPDNLDAALRAAELFNLNIAGVDIITTDISRSWTETGAIINEVNYSPLLGGAAISKSHVPEFLRRLLGGDGRLPVDVFIGGEQAMARAVARQREQVARGARCYLSSHDRTLDPAGLPMAVALDGGLQQRCRALLLNRQVERIILVVQTDEPLRVNLPIYRISGLSVVRGEALATNAGSELDPQRLDRVVALFRTLRARGAPLPGTIPSGADARS